MPVASPVFFWEADVVVETKNLAFSPQTLDEGRGVLAKRVFKADRFAECRNRQTRVA